MINSVPINALISKIDTVDEHVLAIPSPAVTVSVQRGRTQVTAPTGLIGENITITAVDRAKSFCTISATPVNMSVADIQVSAYLWQDTVLQVSVFGPAGVTVIFIWEVITYA